MNKYICGECEAKIRDKDILRAVNPFDETEMITCCPECKAVDSSERACDFSGCWERASQGFPVSNGYMFACHKHGITGK